MKYISTGGGAPAVDFRQAVIHSLPPDRGLYVPQEWPVLEPAVIERLTTAPLTEIGRTVAAPFVGDTINPVELERIVDAALTFDAPLVPIDPQTEILELFHGPSMAFKDFGARFMARIMSHFNRNEDRELTVLVATSGDTGGAVAAGFEDVPGIRVVILFPKGRVSALQEAQLTGHGKNICALEVDGSFDDCQTLVKDAFLSPALSELRLTSANSINIARLIPQSFYYFYAVQGRNPAGLCFVVPSGNFGNLSAGLIARRLGLPIGRFLAANNANQSVARFLDTGHYESAASVQTLSNAMDVGAPSNFPRMRALYSDAELRGLITGDAIADADTRTTIERTYRTTGYLLDPHTAVGLAAWQRAQLAGSAIVLGTAHPAKFWPTIEETLGPDCPDFPDALRPLLEGPKYKQSIATADDLTAALKA